MEKLTITGTGNVLEYTAENFKAIIEFNQLETYIERLEYWKINQLDSNFGVVGRTDLHLYYVSEGEEKSCIVMDIYPNNSETNELKLFYNYKVQLVTGYLINDFNETYCLKNTAHQRKDWIDFELQRIENKLNPEFIDNNRTEYFRAKCKSFLKGYNNERKGIGMVHRQYFDNENSIIEGAAYYRYKFHLKDLDWNDLGNNFKTNTNFRKKYYSAKFYCLTYIIECYANGEQPILANNKAALELIGYKISNGKISGNTFYKNYSGTLSIELDKKLKIEDNFGFDWKDKILEITSIPDKVKSYFESQNL